MKIAQRLTRLVLVLVSLAALAASGCSSVRKKIEGARFHETATVPGEAKVVFDTSRTVLESMGFVHDRGSAATGHLEMSARVQPGGTAQLLRQRTLILEVNARGSEGTAVSIGFWEYSSEANPTGPSITAGKLLHGGTLYDVYWEKLEVALKAQGIDREDDIPKAPAAK